MLVYDPEKEWPLLSLNPLPNKHSEIWIINQLIVIIAVEILKVLVIIIAKGITVKEITKLVPI